MKNRWISITSPQNEQVKKWKKLHTRKGRIQSGQLLIEGEHLIQEALTTHISVQALIVSSDSRELAERLAIDSQFPIYECTPTIFSTLVETESPQGIAAVIDMPTWSWEQLVDSQKQVSTYLLLDEVQDPGNLGTILRTAEAAGVTGIFLGTGTVDPFNAKAVRSAMGSLFRLPMLQIDLNEAIPRLQAEGITIIGTSPHAGTYHFQLPFPQKVAILLGNEGRGVNPTLAQLANHDVMIPMPGRTESLNVSITTAILLYERVRQTMMKK